MKRKAVVVFSFVESEKKLNEKETKTGECYERVTECDGVRELAQDDSRTHATQAANENKRH